MTLSPAQERFVVHWGEMGSRWGVNRTVAQIHALLFLSPEPLTAEEIAETLDVARSNVSTSLKELRGWGLVRITHRLGDRRDHFETLTDVWEMLHVILEQRKIREIDPTVEMLRECIAAPGADRETTERLGKLLELLEVTGSWYELLRPLPPARLEELVRTAGRVRRAIGRGRRAS